MGEKAANTTVSKAETDHAAAVRKTKAEANH